MFSWKIHRNGETFAAHAGDCFMQPPGTRHCVGNTSATEDLVYYIIANEDAASQSIRHAP